MKQSIARWAFVPVVAAIVLVADQWTKALVEKNLPMWGAFAPFPALEPWFKLVHYSNTGAAFGLLRGQSSLFVLIALVVIVAVLVFARQLPTDNWAVRFCLGLQLGGAAGNLLDRLLKSGHVTDFLLLTLPVGGKVYQWPAFNVADSSIVVGVILLGILILGSDREHAAGERVTS